MIVAAFASLAVGLVLVFVFARHARAFWAIAALLAVAAILFAVQMRTAGRGAKQLEASIDKQCTALAWGLESDARQYRLLKAAGSASAVSQLQDRYRTTAPERGQMAELCAPTVVLWNWWDCLPSVLTDDTLARIEPAATAVRNRQKCDTISSVPLEVRCRELGQSLRADALTYRTAITETWSSNIVSELQSSYAGRRGRRSELVRACVPGLTTVHDCIPDALDAQSVDRLERAAAAIEIRERCDTRTLTNSGPAQSPL